MSSFGQVLVQQGVIISHHLSPQRQQAVLTHQRRLQIGHRRDGPSAGASAGLVRFVGAHEAGLGGESFFLFEEEVQALAAAVGAVGLGHVCPWMEIQWQRKGETVPSAISEWH